MEGGISEQGRFDDLNSAGGYVSSFALQPPDWDYNVENEFKSSSSEVNRSHPNPVQTADDIEAEANRRTGDISIYLYYIRSIGWIPTIIFTAAISAFIFCISFPSEDLGSTPVVFL